MIQYTRLAVIHKENIMDVNLKKHYLRASIYFSAVYLLTYLLYHVTNYVAESELLVYLSEMVNRSTYLLLPMLSSVAMLVASIYAGPRRAILCAIPMMLTRLLYVIPYFYMMNYVYALGYATAEAIPLAIALAIGESAVTFGICVLLFFIMRLLLAKLSSGKELASLVEEPSGLFSSSPMSTVIRIISGAATFYFLINEIIDSVRFLIKYFDSIRAGEFLYMCWLFVFDAALFFIHYAVISYVKNRSVANMEFASED